MNQDNNASSLGSTSDLVCRTPRESKKAKVARVEVKSKVPGSHGTTLSPRCPCLHDPLSGNVPGHGEQRMVLGPSLDRMRFVVLEAALILLTANIKHFSVINQLKINRFDPES